uniref:Small nuclear ribonucleoprotein G n=1 Tax=Mus spicilegus TaxID=10103 RepID=A0A8C6HLT6_MUSSI
MSSPLVKAHPPELKKLMDKKLSLKLNGGRHVQGMPQGFDPFMNLVIDERMEIANGREQNNIGTVVRWGNGIIMSEALERVNTVQLLKQWTPRSWNFPRNLMLGKGKGWSLVPGRGGLELRHW